MSKSARRWCSRFNARGRRGRGTGRIEVSTARTILSRLGAEEPADRSASLLLGDGIFPAHIVEKHPTSGKKVRERHPINPRGEGTAGAWMMIHGIEDGWFERDRTGHLQMAPVGLERRTACTA